MSDYTAVKKAMEAGTPPELICQACPWDRLCITPPAMTGADVEETLRKAEQDDAKRDPARQGMGVILTALIVGGKDTQAQLCPVFSMKLRSPDGRALADALRSQMRGEA